VGKQARGNEKSQKQNRWGDACHPTRPLARPHADHGRPWRPRALVCNWRSFTAGERERNAGLIGRAEPGRRPGGHALGAGPAAIPDPPWRRLRQRAPRGRDAVQARVGSEM